MVFPDGQREGEDEAALESRHQQKKKKVKREGHPHLPRSFCTMVGLAWLFTDGAVERSFLGEPGEHLLHLWVAAGAGPAITSHSARV